MKVLVTGGAGYIGSHVCRALRRSGFDVRIYDNLSTGRRELADGYELIVGDLCEKQKLYAALDGVYAVLHLAAQSCVMEAIENPRRCFQNNSVGTLNLLNAMMDRNVRMLVFSSSASVYGIPPTIPIRESSPRRPIQPYGVSKLFDEMALESYSRAYQLRSVVLRHFNTAGADENSEAGLLNDPETHLIPSILLVAADVTPEVQIFGDDYLTPDGTCVRDFVHISDLAAGYVAALEYLLGDGESIACNLGSGRGYSIRQILTAIQAVTGEKLPVRILPKREGDPPALVADVTRARKVLGWKSTQSLQDIVSSSWARIQKAHPPRSKMGEEPIRNRFSVAKSW